MKKWISLAVTVVILFMMIGCSRNTQPKPFSMQNSDTDFTLSLLSDSLDRDNIFTNRDVSAGYDDKVYNITLADNKSSSDNKKVEIDGNVITITNTGTYIIKGSLSNGQLVVDADDTDKIQLVFSGAEIRNTSTAALNIVEAKKVFITVAEKSKNTLSTTKEFIKTEENKADGVIYSKQNVTLNGSGELYIESPYGHGIVCNDDLVITNGNYNISAGKHCIKANDNINIAGGKFALTSGKDAFHCDNDQDKDKGNIYIQKADVSISAEDDAIHASGYIIMDDGNITISNSYEGIEAEKIEINGGKISLKATDDGLNAASNSSNDENQADKSNPFNTDENCYINIAGGDLVIDADGDGIDSNGYLQQTGGNVTVYGAENSGNGALDYDISAKITGGKMVAFGYSGMAQGFGTASTQGSMLICFDTETTDALILTDSKGNQIITAKTNKKYNSVVLSTADILKGKTYTVSAGSQSKTIKMDEITYTDSNAFGGKHGDGENFDGGNPRENGEMPNGNPPEPPSERNENADKAI